MVELSPHEAAEGECSEPPSEMVRDLMWAANMKRSDIATVCRKVARYSFNPSKKHWTAMVKILKYLLATKDLGLRYSGNGDPTFYAYADSTYACNKGKRPSVPEGAVVIGCSRSMIK